MDHLIKHGFQPNIAHEIVQKSLINNEDYRWTAYYHLLNTYIHESCDSDNDDDKDNDESLFEILQKGGLTKSSAQHYLKWYEHGRIFDWILYGLIRPPPIPASEERVRQFMRDREIHGNERFFSCRNTSDL